MCPQNFWRHVLDVPLKLFGAYFGCALKSFEGASSKLLKAHFGYALKKFRGMSKCVLKGRPMRTYF
jgi:hypothetical protein